MNSQIIAELVKHGWEVYFVPIFETNIVRYPVKTFRGVDYAHLSTLTDFEYGQVGVHANFISKGENALALCHAYIANSGEVAEKITEFHAEVMEWLSRAFSVRMAN